MKKSIILICLITIFHLLSAQEWIVEVEEMNNSYMQDMISVDEGEFVLGTGYTGYPDYFDGVVVKVGKDGSSIGRSIHLTGKMLQYYCAVQLANGNYMVFGVSDDSLCDSHFQQFLRIDVFNNQLETLYSKTYNVDDDVFDCFYNAYYGKIMKSMVSKSGSVILAARLSYSNNNSYRSALRFYEFEETGEILRIIDNPHDVACAGGIEKLAYEPHSDNFLVAIYGGNFPPNSGIPGIYVADANCNVVAKQDFIQIQGGISLDLDNISQISCEGKWIDDDFIIVDVEKRIHRSTSTYHSLYKVDSALNVYAELHLPPFDSCTWTPSGTSTSYFNDTTIFAFTYCSQFMWSNDKSQVNVILVDKYLNLWGRKVIQKDNVQYFCSTSPALFEDGGCIIAIYSRNGDQYSGDPFEKVQLMKFRREDIEITWDVIQEQELKFMTSAYPNPTKEILNIPIDETKFERARIQILDMKGVKCLDCAITKQGSLISLDIQNLVRGAYVYRVVSNSKEIITGKFIKE